MTKETEDKIRQQLHELLDIVIDTNGLERRARSETGTLPTLFISYSGRVNSITINLHPDGWIPGFWADKEILHWVMEHPLMEEQMDRIRRQCAYALRDKKESEALGRNIASVEVEIENRKRELSEMKRKHRKLEKEGR